MTVLCDAVVDGLSKRILVGIFCDVGDTACSSNVCCMLGPATAVHVTGCTATRSGTTFQAGQFLDLVVHMEIQVANAREGYLGVKCSF